MNYCSNATSCDSTCEPLFSDLPLGVCRVTRLGTVSGHIELRNTKELVVCQNKSLWPMSWILGAAGGAVALCMFVIIGVYQYRRRRARRAGYAIIN